MEYAMSYTLKHANVQHIPASELYLIVKPRPFHGQALDIICQVNPPSSKGHKFILVAVNYFTKWVEAKALKEVTQNEVINFVEEQILQRFGIPESLTTDQGTMFIGRKVVEYANLRNIKLITLTPYYT